jgi:ubiquitin carboxyl-terminal hydrolase 9/24
LILYFFTQRDVPATFINLALDDGPAPPIKYQCADLSKLYQCVALLVRSCDVSQQRCKSSLPEEAPKPNPFMIQSISPLFPSPPLQQSVAELLYGRG